MKPGSITSLRHNEIVEHRQNVYKLSIVGCTWYSEKVNTIYSVDFMNGHAFEWSSDCFHIRRITSTKYSKMLENDFRV